MRSLGEREQINNFLGRKGLATLDNPGGMVQQLGYLIQGHEHCRQLLVKCEPAERHNMYESLRPHLRFEAKPLDVYIAEAGQKAEAEQLPTITPDGKFQAFRTADIRTSDGQTGTTEYAEVPADDTTAQAAVNQTFAKKWLDLICRGCTAEATFTGDTKTDCWFNARIAGWKYHNDGEGYELCPDCARPKTGISLVK